MIYLILEMQNPEFLPTMLGIFLLSLLYFAAHKYITFWKCNVDARLEPLLKLNNVDDNLPMEKCFLKAETKTFQGGKAKRGT